MTHQEGVILTKDNLLKRNQNGSKSCVFCSRDETIEHLFFECLYAKFLWQAIHRFGLKSLLNVMDIFYDWHKGVDQIRRCYWQVVHPFVRLMASKKWYGFREMSTQISFAGFIQRNALATTLVTVAKVWWNQGSLLPCLSGARNDGYAVLCFFWMAK